VTVERLEGSMTDPGTLRDALDRVRPDAVVIVSAPVPGRDTAHADAEAVLAVMHIRSMTWQAEVPIVTHVFTRLQALEATDNPWLTAVHSQEVMAGALAAVVIERSSATAAERLLEGIDATLEAHRYPPEPEVERTFAAVHRAALAGGTAVLGLAGTGRPAVLNPAGHTLVRPGDLLLVARRRPAGS
jgi:hypothetical protein